MESKYQLCSIQNNTILVYTANDSFDSVQKYFSQFGSPRINMQNDGLSYITYDNLKHLEQAKLSLNKINSGRNSKKFKTV